MARMLSRMRRSKATSSGRTAARKARHMELVETLEPRLLLSAADIFHPLYMVDTALPFAAAPLPSSVTPAILRQAYGIVGDGTGQTIAIVDAYHAPTLLQDLQTFDATFGLPDPPSFTVINQRGGTTPPPTDPAGPGNSWAMETSLDVQWAHVVAPGADILVVEADDASNNLFTAVDTARNWPGVSVVSMSWGATETAGDTAMETYFTTPAGHQGVTFLAGSGDWGSYDLATGNVATFYPGCSPSVVGVGGTALTTDALGNYVSEVAWGNGANSAALGGSGGGLSAVFAQPTYQTGTVTQSTTQRGVPDVAWLADPATGVAVIDSYDLGAASPWTQVGGTSLATPLWGGLIALINQTRAATGSGTLDGISETLPMLYTLPATNFHDILSGSNGAYSAGTGYDLVTGRGTPMVSAILDNSLDIHLVPLEHDIHVGQFYTAPVAGFHATASVVGGLRATIDWGDGTAVQSASLRELSPGVFGVVGPIHIYTQAGTYNITTTIGNNNVQSVTHVLDASVALWTNAQTGTPNSGFQAASIGRFNDTNANANLSDYRIVIDWGDGWVDSTYEANSRIGVSEVSRNPQQGVIWQISTSHYYTDHRFDAYRRAVGAALPTDFTGTVKVIKASTGQTVATQTFAVHLAGPAAAPMVATPNPNDPNRVQVIDANTQQTLFSYTIVGPGFTGQTNAITADITGDGAADVIMSTTAPGDPVFYVFNGTNGALVAGIKAFAERGMGASVTAGDVNGDGVPDVIVGIGPGPMSRVRVFDGMALRHNTANVLADLAVYGSGFAGGVSVAAITNPGGSGRADLLVAPMSLANSAIQPKVIYGMWGGLINQLPSLQQYGLNNVSGYRVAAGDVNNDGTPEALVTPMTGTPRLFAFSAYSQINTTTMPAVLPTPVTTFDLFGSGFNNGLTMFKTMDYNQDGKLDLFASATQNGTLYTRIYDGTTLMSTRDTLYSFPA